MPDKLQDREVAKACGHVDLSVAVLAYIALDVVLVQ
jgi:hypothetical protein